MKTFQIEIIIGSSCYPVEIEGESIRKISYGDIVIDNDKYWSLPSEDLDISFGEIIEINGD